MKKRKLEAFRFAPASIFPKNNFVGFPHCLIFRKMCRCPQKSPNVAEIFVRNSKHNAFIRMS